MSRSERIRGQWPDKPDHMLVRLAHDPLRIYAKWLPDGAHAGQEIIYDESERTDEMYGHLGGIMNVMPLWTSLNGALARAQSNHQVRDLGTEYIARQYLAEGKKYIEAGLPRATQDGSQNDRRRARGRLHFRNADRPAAVLREEGNARARSAASVLPHRRVL